MYLYSTGIGYTSALATLIASGYYSVIIAYPVVFIFHSFTNELPWSNCRNSWNTDNCVSFFKRIYHIQKLKI